MQRRCAVPAAQPTRLRIQCPVRVVQPAPDMLSMRTIRLFSLSVT